MLKDCWKHLPPGYRQVTGAGKSQPGDLRWLSDVQQWHEVTNAEVGKTPDNDIYIFATPDTVKGAIPGYRRTKPTGALRPGMLVWKDGQWNEQIAIDYAGEPFAKGGHIIEPKPPAGWEWLHKGDEINPDTDRKLNPSGGTQQAQPQSAKQSAWGTW